jgi:uncharacterized protein (TIGR00369 family)
MDFPTPIPFVEALGFSLIDMDAGTSRITFEPRPEHLNSFHVTHGGASMTLLDVTMAHAARSLAVHMGVVTIEMKTSFMQPAKGPLTADGKVLHRTATLAFTEGTIRDASGRICAHATGTFKYLPRLANGDRTINTLGGTPTP